MYFVFISVTQFGMGVLGSLPLGKDQTQLMIMTLIVVFGVVTIVWIYNMCKTEFPIMFWNNLILILMDFFLIYY